MKLECMRLASNLVIEGTFVDVDSATYQASAHLTHPSPQAAPKRARTEKTHILDNAPRAMNVGQSSSLTPASLDQPQQVSLPFCVYAPSGDVLVSSSADIRSVAAGEQVATAIVRLT